MEVTQFLASHYGGGVLDLAQRETSMSCQRPVEMVGSRVWNGWLCDRKRNTLPYVLVAEIFRNGIGLIIVWTRPFEIRLILLWIYMRNVNMAHRPIFIMMVSLLLCSLRDMATTALTDQTTTKYGLITAWCSFSFGIKNRMAVIISGSMTVAKQYFSVTLYLQTYDSMSPPLSRIWYIRRGKALQGQMLKAKYMWWMVWTMRPFFLLVILRVIESAWMSRRSGKFHGSWQPYYQKLTFPTVKCFVRVSCLRVPSRGRTYLGAVYLPHQRR